jgi:hypothetical protein
VPHPKSRAAHRAGRSPKALSLKLRARKINHKKADPIKFVVITRVRVSGAEKRSIRRMSHSMASPRLSEGVRRRAADTMVQLTVRDRMAKADRVEVAR